MRKIIDGSLDKIHEIQKKHYLERRNWSWEKEKKYYHDISARIAVEFNARLVKTKSGSLRLVINK